jgi:fibronectin-binding autotransporter adhesin
MKTNISHFRLPHAGAIALTVLLATAAAPLSSQATTYTWTGAAGNPWTDAGSWQGNVAPPSSLTNTDLVFGSTNAPYPSIDAPYSIHSLTFTAGATGYAFDSDPLTIGAGGIDQNAANAEIFSTAQVILGANQSWTLASNSGALTFGSGLATGGFALTLDAATTTGTGNVINGVISGSGSLTAAGSGIVVLTGMNTYTGGTAITAGTLVESNNGNALSAGTVAIGSGATLQLSNTSTSTTVSQEGATTFTGAGTLQKTGAGAVQFGGNGGNVNVSLSAGGLIDVEAGTLDGSSSHQGLYTNNSAGLHIASGAIFDGVEGTIVVDALTGAGTLQGGYNSSAATTTIGIANGSGTFSGVIKDSGDLGGVLALIKAGTGTETLTGANTYTGGTTLGGGVINLGSSGALSGSGTLSFTGGTLQYSAANATDYSGRFATAANQAYSIDTNGQSVTFATALTSSAGSLTKLGEGKLILTGANTYTGMTTIGAGTLSIGSGGTTGTLGSSSGNVVDSAALVFNRSDSMSVANIISGTGTVTQSGTGTLTLMGTNTYSGTTSISAGTLAIGNGGTSGSLGSGSVMDNATLSFDRSNSATVANAISGAGGVTKVGTGTITLMAANTYSGTTIASAGILQLGNANAAQASTVALAGGTLALSSGIKTFNVGGLSGSGNLALTDTSSTAATLVVGANNANTTYSGTLSGGGSLTKTGNGVLMLTATNSYTGPTAVSAGVLQAATTASLPGYGTSGMVTVASNAELAVNYGGSSDWTSSQVDAAREKVNFQSGSMLAVDTTNATAPVTYASNISGSLGITKAGAGTLMLTGSNTFTGAVDIAAGTLAIPSASALGAAGQGQLQVAGPGSLQITGSTTLPGSVTLGTTTLQTTAGNTLTYVGTTVTGGTLGAIGSHSIQNGSTLNGTAVAPASTVAVSGSVSFAGVTIGGAVAQGSGSTLSASNTTVAATGSVQVSGTLNSANTSSSGTLAVQNGGVLNNTTGPLILGPGSMTTILPGGEVTSSTSTPIVVNGTLANSGTLTGSVSVSAGGSLSGYSPMPAVLAGRGGTIGPDGRALEAPGITQSNQQPSPSGLWNAGHSSDTTSISVGTFTAESLSVNAGSTLTCNVQDASGAAGVGYDTYHVLGALTLNAGPGANVITVAPASLASDGTPGMAANFDSTKSQVFTLVTADGGITGFNPAEFAVDTSNFENSLGSGSFFVAEAGNNLDLDFTPVPEPATWAGALGCLGLVGLTLHRRRHSASRAGGSSPSKRSGAIF